MTLNLNKYVYSGCKLFINRIISNLLVYHCYLITQNSTDRILYAKIEFNIFLQLIIIIFFDIISLIFKFIWATYLFFI